MLYLRHTVVFAPHWGKPCVVFVQQVGFVLCGVCETGGGGSAWSVNNLWVPPTLQKSQIDLCQHRDPAGEKKWIVLIR